MVVRADVFEVDGWIVIEAEVPGVAEASLEVLVGDGVVSIRGRIETPDTENGRTYRRRERHTGPFRRDVPLPSAVSRDDAFASHRQGLLVIRIAKDRDPHPERIPIPIDLES